MRISVGIDIAKEVHWVTAVDHDGVVLIDRKLANTPAAIASLIDELKGLEGRVRIGLDVVGGVAGLAAAMLAEAGFALAHVPGAGGQPRPSGHRRRRAQVRPPRRSGDRRAGAHPPGPAPDRAGQ